MTEPDLTWHGDRQAAAGLIDFAANVRVTPPGLMHALAQPSRGWDLYPDQTDALAAVAERFRVDADRVLLTNGGAEAFTLLAGLRPWAKPVVVHPQFTEPEAALRALGHDVVRAELSPADDFTLNPALIPDDADLVMIGNPTNPTGVLHDRAHLLALCRPGRLVVVDEAFMDFVADPDASLAREEMPGLVVVRSFTKMWGIAGLRAGCLFAAPSLVAELRARQTPWPVSTPALDAICWCMGFDGAARAEAEMSLVDDDRADFIETLNAAGFPVVGYPATPFLLVDTSRFGPTSMHEPLAQMGFAARRCDTFPGLGPTWLRVAVREPSLNRALVTAMTDLAGEP